MDTFKAVLSGFLVTSVLMFAAGWAFGLLTPPTMQGEPNTPSLLTAFLALVYTSAAIVAGAYVASRIHDSSETISGFAVTQAFFGFGLIREFWSGGSPWPTAVAVLLVIPGALIGWALARRFGRRAGGSSLIVSAHRLVVVALAMPALGLRGQLPDPAMIGTWSGDAQIVVNWTDQSSIHVRLGILADGSVSGQVGDAQLKNGRMARNRGALGRLLQIKTDYIVSGQLHGPVIASEHIQRDGVKIPLNWDGSVFSGGLHTSGSAFGGADRMALSAFHLRLTRDPPALVPGSFITR